jgi:hypothetical protein
MDELLSMIPTGADLIKEGMKIEREWQDKIYVENGCLVLNIIYPYQIELNRIDTPLKLLAWIGHLLEKNWVSRDVIYWLIRTWEKHFKKTIDLNV